MMIYKDNMLKLSPGKPDLSLNYIDVNLIESYKFRIKFTSIRMHTKKL
jgi:hypothetical protein